MLLLAFLLAFALGGLLLRCLLPAFQTRPRWAGWLLVLSLACGLGMGLTSTLYFVLLWAGLARYEIAFECAVLAALALVIQRLRLRRAAVAAPEAPSFPWNWLLLLLLASCALFFALSFREAAVNNPQGELDAWATWNLRAKYLAGGDPVWRNATSPLLDKSHPGYPLLLPGFIGRCWAIAGQTTFTAPLVVACLFPALVCGMLAGALALLSSLSMGLLAVLVLFATGAYIGQSPAQYPDLPLSFFLLAALVMLACAERFRGHPSFLVTAGVAAGMAAWTKNEGAGFLALALIACVIFLGFRPALRFTAGAAPFAVLLIAFKTLLVPHLTTVIGQSTAGISRFFDPGRYWQILAAMVTDVWEAGFPASHPLLAFAIVAVFLRFRPKSDLRALRVVALPATGMLAVYFLIMLAEPGNLRTVFESASARMLMQIWPCLLLVGFLALRSPEELAAYPEPSRKKHRSRA